jgi:hypothetical protein
MSKYNGWSNMPTWQVANDILNHHQWDDSESITVEYLKELVDNAVFDNTGVATSALIAGYARRFLRDVNWNELVEAYNTRPIITDVLTTKEYMSLKSNIDG